MNRRLHYLYNPSALKRGITLLGPIVSRMKHVTPEDAPYVTSFMYYRLAMEARRRYTYFHHFPSVYRPVESFTPAELDECAAQADKWYAQLRPTTLRKWKADLESTKLYPAAPV